MLLICLLWNAQSSWVIVAQLPVYSPKAIHLFFPFEMERDICLQSTPGADILRESIPRQRIRRGWGCCSYSQRVARHRTAASVSTGCLLCRKVTFLTLPNQKRQGDCDHQVRDLSGMHSFVKLSVHKVSLHMSSPYRLGDVQMFQAIVAAACKQVLGLQEHWAPLFTNASKCKLEKFQHQG